MSFGGISAGTAVATLLLNRSPFSDGLKSASQELKTFADGNKSAQTRISALGGALTTVGATMTKALTIPLLGAGAAAVKIGNEFEAQMSRVQAISGATGEEFKKLNNLALKLGADTSFSAGEAAEGMENLASAGFSVNEIMQAMPGMLDLAASSGEDLASSADIAASTLRGFGLEANQAAHVADVLAKAAADTNAGVADTGEAMKYVAPVARAMGLSLEEVTAAIGEMSNAGIKGGQAGTSLRAALTRLANPSSKAAKLMKRLGFSAYDSQGKMLPLKDVIAKLQTSTKGLSEQQKQQAISTIFGQEAMSGMLTLIQAGPDELDKLTNSLRNSDGAAKSMADTMLNNTKGSIEAMKGSLETAAILIQQTVAPYIKALADKIAELINKFNSLPESTRNTIIAIAGVVAAIGPVLIILGKVITSVSSIVNIVSKIGPMLSGVGGVMGLLTNPITLVIAAIATLIAIFVALYKNNEDFRNNVQQVWGQIKETIGTIVENLKVIISVFLQYARDIWQKYGDKIISIVQTVFNIIANVVKTALNIVSNIIKIVTGIISGDWSKAWEGIKGIISSVWNGIYNTVKSILNLIVNVISTSFGIVRDTTKRMWSGLGSVIESCLKSAISFITSLPSKAYNWGKDFIQGMINGIKAMAGKVQDAVEGVANKIRRFLHFSVPDEGPLTDYETWMPDFMEGLAKGIKESKGLVTNAIKSLSGDMAINMEPSLAGLDTIDSAVFNGSSSNQGNTIINFNGNYSFSGKNDIDYFMNQAALLVKRKK